MTGGGASGDPAPARLRRRAARIGLLIAAAVILLGGVGLALLVFSGGGRTYPTTPEGWTARWIAAAAEHGRTPGEHWDLWLEVAPAAFNEDDPDAARAALDRLTGLEPITTAVPESIGTVGVLTDHSGDLSGIRDTLRGAVLPGLETALRANDGDAAAAHLERAWTLARVSDASGTLIGGLVNAAVVTATLEVLRSDLRAAAASAAVVDLVSTAPLTDLAWSLRMEREVGVMVMGEFGGAGPIIAGDQAAVYEDLLADWAAYETTRDEQVRARIDAVLHRLENDRVYRLRRPGLDMLVPAVDKAARALRAAAAERDALVVMLALERWRADRGVYPPSLEVLVPAYLPGLPDDPFSDGPLRYRLIDASSDDPFGAYVLYSVGTNRTDDGGVEMPALLGRGLMDPDHAADHVFNRPPEPARSTGIIEDEPVESPEEPQEGAP